METIRKTSIDLSYLHSVTGGDEQFEKVLLSSAISDIDVNVQRLKESWQNQDAPQVRSAAHTLKSVLVIAGLPQLEPACQTLDSAFADGQFHAEYHTQMWQIVHEWATARIMLEELLSGC